MKMFMQLSRDIQLLKTVQMKALHLQIMVKEVFGAMQQQSIIQHYSDLKQKFESPCQTHQDNMKIMNSLVDILKQVVSEK